MTLNSSTHLHFQAESSLEPQQKEIFQQFKTWRTSLNIEPTQDRTTHQGDLHHFLSDATLHRYLVARDWNFEKARQLLESTILWRKENIQRPFGCSMCEEDPTQHCFIPLGWDKLGRVVIYGSPARAVCREVPTIVSHVVQSLEHAWEHPKVQQAGQWVWLVDFKGFGFSHSTQGRLGVSFATTFADHFPERLGKIIMINPPTVFNILLTAIKPFADKRTMDKLVSIKGSSKEISTLLKNDHHITDHIVDWMENVLEMDPSPGLLPSVPEEAKEIQIISQAPWLA